MALPKLEAVRYTTELPISKKKAEYRPFLVKEQKVLLVALESEEDITASNSLFDLIQSCVFNTDEIQLEHLPMTDVEWLFLQIRIKSAGETANILLSCDCHEEAQTPVIVDLRDCFVVEGESNPNIQLTDQIGINLQFPSLKTVQDGGTDINTNEMFNLIEACIESIYDGDEVHTRDDFNKKELIQIVFLLSIITKI